MTKAEIVTEIAEKTGVDKVEVLTTVEAFMNSVKNSLAKGENVYLRGFGSFIVKERAEKTGTPGAKHNTHARTTSCCYLLHHHKHLSYIDPLTTTTHSLTHSLTYQPCLRCLCSCLSRGPGPARLCLPESPPCPSRRTRRRTTCSVQSLSPQRPTSPSFPHSDRRTSGPGRSCARTKDESPRRLPPPSP